MKEIITKYNGGKNGSGTYQQIKNLIPYHDLYIEGFLGSGAIYRNKKTSSNSILIDKDHTLINYWEQNHIPEDIFFCMDTISFIQTCYPLINLLHNSGTSVMIYLDPPYPFFTRRSQKKIYKHELTDPEHEKLLIAVCNLNCYVAISSYRNKMYDQLLRGWNSYEFESQIRIGKSIECIYYNYENPNVLHDYRYIGDNFRERELIKGVKKRTINKFMQMSAVQRNYLLTELMQLLPGSIGKNNDAGPTIKLAFEAKRVSSHDSAKV